MMIFIEHKNSSLVSKLVYFLMIPDSVWDETDCSGKFLRYVITYTFCSVYISLTLFVLRMPTLTRKRIN